MVALKPHLCVLELLDVSLCHLEHCRYAHHEDVERVAWIRLKKSLAKLLAVREAAKITYSIEGCERGNEGQLRGHQIAKNVFPHRNLSHL